MFSAYETKKEEIPMKTVGDLIDFLKFLYEFIMKIFGNFKPNDGEGESNAENE